MILSKAFANFHSANIGETRTNQSFHSPQRLPMAHNTKLAIRDMAMQLPFEANRIEFEGQKEGGQKFKVLISFRICGTSTTRYPPRTFGQPKMNLKCPGLWDSLRAHTRYATKAGTIKATERGVRTAVDATERIGWLPGGQQRCRPRESCIRSAFTGDEINLATDAKKLQGGLVPHPTVSWGGGYELSWLAL